MSRLELICQSLCDRWFEHYFKLSTMTFKPLQCNNHYTFYSYNFVKFYKASTKCFAKSQSDFKLKHIIFRSNHQVGFGMLQAQLEVSTIFKHLQVTLNLSHHNDNFLTFVHLKTRTLTTNFTLINLVCKTTIKRFYNQITLTNNVPHLSKLSALNARYINLYKSLNYIYNILRLTNIKKIYHNPY